MSGGGSEGGNRGGNEGEGGQKSGGGSVATDFRYSHAHAPVTTSLHAPTFPLSFTCFGPMATVFRYSRANMMLVLSSSVSSVTSRNTDCWGWGG